MAATSTVSATTTAAPPTEFLCPLSHKVMTDPVVTIHGDNFQRDAILAWLENMDCDYCPFSGKPMSLQDVIPNYSLRTKIQLWLEDQQQQQNQNQNQNQNSGCGDSRVGEEKEKEEEEEQEVDGVVDDVEYLRKRGIIEKNIEIDTEDFKTKTGKAPIQYIELPMKEIEFTTKTMKPKSLSRISLKSIPTSFFRINKTST